jgi:hypothetical protein
MLCHSQVRRSAAAGLGEALQRVKALVVDLGCGVKSRDRVARLDQDLKGGKRPYIAVYQN